MILTDTQYEQLQREAIAVYPLEAVWHLTTKSGLRLVDNISATPEHAFEVRKADTTRSLKEGLLAVIHSHPDGPACPSEADMSSQIACGVPFAIIVSGHDSAGDYFEWGGAREDLHDRPFRHGVTDCYALIRDYYSVELGITLPDYAREWEWWQQGGNLYLDGVEAAGFVPVPVDEIQPGDMLLATLRGGVPCHAAVYLGNELILHHLTAIKPYDTTRRPVTEPIHRWRQHISHAFRHKDTLP